MKIKELLTSENKWNQGCNARDSEGLICDIFESKAQCFCLYGAMIRCYDDRTEAFKLIQIKVLNELKRNENIDICRWNDDGRRTFAEVRELIEKLDI